jgi:hypothetical protein
MGARGLTTLEQESLSEWGLYHGHEFIRKADRCHPFCAGVCSSYPGKLAVL